MWNVEVLGFVEEGKLENDNDNQRQAQPTCQFWVCNLNAGHIGGRRVVSLLHHHPRPCNGVCMSGFSNT